MITKAIALTLSLIALAGCITEPVEEEKLPSESNGCTDPPGAAHEACVFKMDVEGYGECTFIVVIYNDYKEGGSGITLVGCE